MKIKFLRRLSVFLVLFATTSCFKASAVTVDQDTTVVKKMNRAAFDNRLTAPDQTIVLARKSLALATKLNYIDGMAEANRELGLGFYYSNKPDTAIQYYLEAKKIYDGSNNLKGQARVLNNIGNLYLENDDESSINYFNQAKEVAIKMKDQDLLGSIYINLGNAYNSKKSYNTALEFYNKGNDIFTKLNNSVYIIQCLQDKGVIYKKLGQLDTAQALLLKANEEAKKKDLNTTIAGIDITLTEIFTAKNQPDKADYYWNEGLNYANLLKSNKLQYDYKLARYQMLFKRKDYEGAINNLREVYLLDSAKFASNNSDKLSMLREQYKQREQDQINLKKIEEQRYASTLFIASSIVAALLAVVIFLLINNVNRKAKVNKHLTELNGQISEQKENLNQINHHLEEIIDERTKDLQVKNKKLADYSLHLSHQIRGPIATLKGLLNLERDKLIEQDECIKLMNKCVSDIDENIIDMSGMLHESSKTVIKQPKA